MEEATCIEVEDRRAPLFRNLSACQPIDIHKQDNLIPENEPVEQRPMETFVKRAQKSIYTGGDKTIFGFLMNEDQRLSKQV